MEITKTLKNLGTITIKQIDRATAKEMIIKNHYSHKLGSNHGILNFGIYKDNELMGCAVYGYMMNSKAKIFISSVPDGKILELNRLWISDELGHNAESYLIATSIKLIKKIDPSVVAIQSFADGRLGCGTIYKASNFKYYGYHYTLFYEVIKTGEILHHITIENQKNTNYIEYNTALLNGEYRSFRVKTHRYIYPLHKSFQLTIAKEQPYPTYDKGIEYYNKKINRELIEKNIEKVRKIRESRKTA